MNSKEKKSTIAAALALSAFVGTPALAAENPMDHVGVQHNMYLSCLQEVGGSAADSLIRLVEKCGFKPGMALDDFVKTYQPVIDMDPTIPLTEKMSPYRKLYSDYEFSFFERIDHVVESAKDPAEADAIFAELESEAIEKLDPKSHAGANILGGLSVARHSLKYWSQTVQSGGQANAARWPRWLRALVIVASDIAGAVIVTELGAGAAAGTVASAASDAVGGAIP